MTGAGFGCQQLADAFFKFGVLRGIALAQAVHACTGVGVDIPERLVFLHRMGKHQAKNVVF